MTDAAGLIRGIQCAPEDDAPGLVYADWCDENGRPYHAQFIRLQVASAKAGTGDTAAERNLMRSHRGEILPYPFRSPRTSFIPNDLRPDIEPPSPISIQASAWDGRPGVRAFMERGFIGFIMGPYRQLVARAGRAALDTNPVTGAVPGDYFPHQRRDPPALVRAIVREVEAREGTYFADEPADVLGAAVVLWHRRRLGLPDLLAGPVSGGRCSQQAR